MADLQKYKNPTAEFISTCGGDFGHEKLNDSIKQLASALEDAEDKRGRKEILDSSLVSTIYAYRDLANSLSRLLVFLVLCYKKEKLYKLDLEGMGSNEFTTDEEAFEFWLRECLHQYEDDPGRRSKVKWYVRANNDFKLIERVKNFEKAWVISKFQLRLAKWGVQLPEEVYLYAEESENTVKDLTDLLSWEECRLEKESEYRKEKGRKPSEDLVQAWRKEHEAKREERSLAHRKARMKAPKGEPYQKIHKALKGVTKGDGKSVVIVLRTILEELLPKADVDKDLFNKFLHSGIYSHCCISNEPVKPTKVEAHHVLGRGAAGGDRRILNQIPISQKVHKEIHGQGLSFVLDKYAVTEELLVASALQVLVDYVMWLENQVEVDS